MIIKKADTEEDQLMPDDRPPSRGVRIAGVGVRWWVTAAGLSLVICLTLVGGLIVALQSIATRQKLHHISYKNPGLQASIGVLSSRSILDEDMHAAAEHALRDHYAAHGQVAVKLWTAYTGTTITGFLLAFDELWNKGVRVFLTKGEDEAVKALCHHLRYAAKEALIISPTAFKRSVYCPQLFSLYPKHGALIAAELARIKENGLTRIIPVVTDSEKDLVTQVMATGTAQGFTVENAIQLQGDNTSTLQLQEKLFAYPRAAVWLALGNKLPRLLATVGNILRGHLIMVHAHPTNLLKLLKHPTARRMAEINAVCTTEWAGSSQVSTVARRHFLASLQPKDPLIAALSYDATSLALSALTQHNTDEIQLLKSAMIKEAMHTGITKPGDVLNDTPSGFVIWKRLVMQQLIGKAVLQDSPWLMEGTVKVMGKEKQPWVVVQQTHAPVHLVTQEEVMTLAKQGNCSRDLLVKVTAHDPLSHRPITTAWTPSAYSQLLLLPNGSPNGFTLQTWCKNLHEIQILELGCQGTATHNESLVCITVSGGSEGRRRVRSIVSRYGYPIHRKNYPVRQRKYPIRRQQQGGPFTSAVNSLTTFFNHEDFKGMIPQIGGCVGATGGCAFCFVFLLFNNVAIQPGVCFGACSVAVGGSCTTLLAKGFQYHIDHTVICTELFTQGRLPLSSYIADASYGSRLAITNPRALRGYQTIAAPLVAIMQVSPAVSSVVESIAQPWMRHMEHEEGLRPDDDDLGSLMTSLGLPVCYLVATVLDHIDTIALVTIVALLRRSRT